MKDLLRIMIFLSIILFIFFYFDSPISENETLEAPRTVDPLPAQNLIEKSLDVDRPAEGISTYIGKPTKTWINDYGEPDRIEPSAFGYEWWVYNSSFSHYVMAGVKNGEIVQVYTAGTATDAAPFQIGQSLDDLYRFTIIENEVTVKYEKSIYTFSLRAEDINRQLLVSFDGVYAQLYLDEETKTLQAVRFSDAETLIQHRPYDMMYSGDLLPEENPSSSLQQSIDEANAKQVVDLTNVYRLHQQRKPLSENPAVGIMASKHSQDVAKQQFSTEEKELLDLEKRLTDARIDFKEAGENTATQYFDAAETVHGWSNSPDHRDTLLSNRFNQIGVGVYGKFYTQIFLYQEPTRAESQK
ncbi:CAP-associated domain-containing protein [Planococcus sp. N028]|uniref:CAP-associated domain-containing protein n=1 Tax=Planococcus shixiaomingii TaxID=3058393 RepID=A0ABT8N0D9_9BACL|nr:CAP-associated domain-containing protein [Planococcus sp. N028]MDN7241364.1 CAP-associated domain-containing protein [Planococcus sp. N028]